MLSAWQEKILMLWNALPFFGDAGVRRTLRIPAGNSGCAAVGGAQVQE